MKCERCGVNEVTTTGYNICNNCFDVCKQLRMQEWHRSYRQLARESDNRALVKTLKETFIILCLGLGFPITFLVVIKIMEWFR